MNYDLCFRCNNKTLLNVKDIPHYCSSCFYTSNVWTDKHACPYCLKSVCMKYPSGFWCQSCDNLFSICWNCSTLAELICYGNNGAFRKDTFHKKFFETRLIHSFLDRDMTCMFQCIKCRNVFLSN